MSKIESAALHIPSAEEIVQRAHDMIPMLRALRQHTDLPLAAGFGIQTEEQAQALAQEADLVVVGSELVRSIQAGPIESALERCASTVAAFSHAVHTARERI